MRIAAILHGPHRSEYVGLVFEEFLDIHGDRRFGDDKAVIAGFARIGGQRIVFIGQQKGRTTKEKLACNFGMPHPEGYRKALRAMKLAEKFGLPVVTFIDTMGAYPGIGSEERGVAEAIAVNLMEMSRLRAPLLGVVIGEGGSGGALGLGTGDRLIILEYAYYSVISPEGCAAILWRSGDEAPKAAEALKLTANDLVGSRHHGRDRPRAARRRAERSRSRWRQVEEGDLARTGGIAGVPWTGCSNSDTRNTAGWDISTRAGRGHSRQPAAPPSAGAGRGKAKEESPLNRLCRLERRKERINTPRDLRQAARSNVSICSATISPNRLPADSSRSRPITLAPAPRQPFNTPQESRRKARPCDLSGR